MGWQVCVCVRVCVRVTQHLRVLTAARTEVHGNLQIHCRSQFTNHRVATISRLFTVLGLSAKDPNAYRLLLNQRPNTRAAGVCLSGSVCRR